jgi:hypothetical protein
VPLPCFRVGAHWAVSPLAIHLLSPDLFDHEIKAALFSLDLGCFSNRSEGGVVDAVGIESTVKRTFNNMQVSG